MSNDPAVQALQMHLKNELPDDRVAMVLCLVQPLLAERDAAIARVEALFDGKSDLGYVAFWELRRALDGSS